MSKILTPVQMEWVKEQLKDFDVVYSGVHGVPEEVKDKQRTTD